MNSMNRLRVVNFDKPVSDKEVSGTGFEETFRKVSKYNEYKPFRNKTEGGEIYSKHKHLATSAKKGKKKTGSKDAKRNSELFRNFSSNRCYKNWSFDDIRKTLKSNSKLRHGRKKGLKHDENNKRDNSRHRKSQDDIEVLYFFDRSNRQRAQNCSETNNNFPYGVEPSSHTYLCYQTCKHTGLFPDPKRKKKKPKRQTFNLHAVCPLGIRSRKLKKSSSSLNKLNRSASEHFGLVAFPVCEKLSGKRSSCALAKRIYSISQQLLCKDTAEAWAEPCSIGCYDGPTSKVDPVISMCAGPPVSSCNNYCPNKRSKSLLRCSAFNNFYTTHNTIIKRIFYLLTLTLKYFLIILAILVWLPCLIVAALFMGLISLCKPLDVDCGPKMVCKCRCIWQKWKKWLMRPCHEPKPCPPLPCLPSVPCAPIEPCAPTEPCVPLRPCERRGPPKKIQPKKKHSKWKPDPKKKYTLYYCDKRGWLIKPDKNYCTQCASLKSSPGKFSIQNRQDKTVTFWDSKLVTCKCPESDEKNLDGRDPVSRSPICGKCPIPLRKYNRKGEIVLKPCPVAAPCPIRTERRKRQKQLMKKLYSIRSCAGSTGRVRDPRYKPCLGAKLEMMARKRCSKVKHSKSTEKISRRKKFDNACMNIWSDLKASEKEAWGDGVQCGHIFISSLKKRPCLWIYRRCPDVYPLFLLVNRACSNCCYGGMFIVACCVWCPLFFCLYICYNLCCMTCGCGN